MRSVPQLRFYFDTSVGQGRHLEDLIRRAADADRHLGLRDEETGEEQ
jgi:ribosome-binding factor A